MGVGGGIVLWLYFCLIVMFYYFCVHVYRERIVHTWLQHRESTASYLHHMCPVLNHNMGWSLYFYCSHYLCCICLAEVAYLVALCVLGSILKCGSRCVTHVKTCLNPMFTLVGGTVAKWL